jgi:hypothetical protein
VGFTCRAGRYPVLAPIRRENKPRARTGLCRQNLPSWHSAQEGARSPCRVQSARSRGGLLAGYLNMPGSARPHRRHRTGNYGGHCGCVKHRSARLTDESADITRPAHPLPDCSASTGHWWSLGTADWEQHSSVVLHQPEATGRRRAGNWRGVLLAFTTVDESVHDGLAFWGAVEGTTQHDVMRSCALLGWTGRSSASDSARSSSNSLGAGVRRVSRQPNSCSDP